MYFLLTNLLDFTRILNLKTPQKVNKKRKKQSYRSFPEPESANVATYKEEASWELIQIETAYFLFNIAEASVLGHSLRNPDFKNNFACSTFG